MNKKELVYPASYWRLLSDGRLQCDLCPRYCKLREGQRGLCFVRKNQGGKMDLTTYGRSSGFCIDPIEKKPLNHFYPGTSVLSFGTAGCNLSCQFCQNWDISKSREFDQLSHLAKPEHIAKRAKDLGCQSVAFTYNDPVIFIEYAIDIAKACHALGIKTVVVTAGYITDSARPDFFEHMDAANIDLKAFSQSFYENITAGNLEPVLKTLIYLKNETNVWFEITNLLIPGENDSKDELENMIDWILAHLGKDVPLHFTAFHPDYKMLEHAPTPESALVACRRLALKKGIKYVYLGNIHDSQGGNTYCSHCGELLIERDWYVLGKYQLEKNKCCFCQNPLPGVYAEKPGSWGAKRVKVKI